MRAAAIGACIDVISCPMPTQVSLFGGSSKPSVVCRSSRAKERVEWQADFYASCLLMSKEMVVAAWRERFGNANPRILRRKNRIAPPGDASDELTAAIHSYEQQRDNEALQEFVRPFAERFKVSAAAMRIRLERLGLLRREVPRQGGLGCRHPHRVPAQEQTMRAALYLRVSTMNGQTTDNQRLELQAAAERHGWRIVQVYADEGISGAEGREKAATGNYISMPFNRSNLGSEQGLIDEPSAWPGP